MTEALEKIQTIFKDSKTFALLSKKISEDFRLLAKEALKCVLLEKKLGVVSLPEHPDFQKKWKVVLPEKTNNSISRQTSIRIPKNQYKIKELNYEDEPDFLSLVLTSENGNLNKDAVIFESVRPKADAVFCFFEPNEIELLQNLENEITLPQKEKIIFLTSNGVTFAEKIAQIARTAAADVSSLPQISTLLFASLITETNNFVRPINQDLLRFGSELLSSGANKEMIKTVLDEEKTISFGCLLGRGLARTHIDETSDASWTFLSQKDLEKTENLSPPSSLFYAILKNLRENIPYRTFSFLFWQTPLEVAHSSVNSINSPIKHQKPGLLTGQNGQNVLAMAAADEEEKLIPLACTLGAKLQSKYLTAGPFKNFSEAEMRFRQALRETGSLKI